MHLVAAIHFVKCRLNRGHVVLVVPGFRMELPPFLQRLLRQQLGGAVFQLRTRNR